MTTETTPARHCDRTEHDGLLPLQHLVEHLRWGCTGQAQQAWLLQAVFDEHAHQLAERIRNTDLPADYVDMFDNGTQWAADLIDPAPVSSGGAR